MKKSKTLIILAFLCFMETGFILSFPKWDTGNKVASVPIIAVFGFLIFQLIKSFGIGIKFSQNKGKNFLDLDESKNK